MFDEPNPIRVKEAEQRRMDDVIRRALATPPISNEDILKRSKESHRK